MCKEHKIKDIKLINDRFFAFFQERRLAQQKIEILQSELIEKEREIEQYKYKLKLKADELEREKQERAEETVLLTHEIENLKYMKNVAMSQYDEHNDLLKQMELIKKVHIVGFVIFFVFILFLTINVVTVAYVVAFVWLSIFVVVGIVVFIHFIF